MKMAKVAIRVLVYIICFATLIISVVIRRIVVTNQRTATPVSYIEEISRYGKPVTACKVKSAIFNMKEKFTVVPRGEKQFEGYVTRRVASNLEEGQLVNALNGHSGAKGKIIYLSPEVDMMSGLYRLEIEFEDPIVCSSGKLLIETKVGEKKDIIEVPNDVLYIEDGKFYLWKIIEGKAYREEVELSARSGYSSIISSGLNKDDILVLTGQSQLKEGDRVRIVNNKDGSRQE